MRILSAGNPSGYEHRIANGDFCWPFYNFNTWQNRVKGIFLVLEATNSESLFRMLSLFRSSTYNTIQRGTRNYYLTFHCVLYIYHQ